MKETATVKIFLAEGDPASVRTAEISNWTGKAVAGPRSQLELILQRAETKKPGIYFLSGINSETGKPRVYVGEAEVVGSRLKGHLNRDFWKTVIFFVSKDENLTKAHIKYLEGKLIEMTKAADRFELENTNASGSSLPESDTADMDVFLSKVEQLLPVLGQDFLKPVVKLSAPVKPSALLTCAIKNVKATGRPTENGFLVLKESEAVLEERPSVKKYPYPSTVRSQLLAEGTLTKETDRLVFAKDYEFSSPSAAASVVHGGHANGLIAWKNDNGVTLKDLEQKEMSNH
ncbi:MAG: GIY-YIG nuclease family protein [Promethearchaeia archaeon]